MTQKLMRCNPLVVQRRFRETYCFHLQGWKPKSIKLKHQKQNHWVLMHPMRGIELATSIKVFYDEKKHVFLEIHPWKSNLSILIITLSHWWNDNIDSKYVQHSNLWIRTLDTWMNNGRVAGFPQQRPEFEPRSGHVGYVLYEVALGQVFLRVLRSPQPILIPPAAPHSSSSSIIRGWYNRPSSGRRTEWIQSHPTARK
jgi:hypothetical protein